MTGCEDFVQAIDHAGDALISVGVLQDPARRFVVLLSEDLSTWLGAVEICRGPTEPPDSTLSA